MDRGCPDCDCNHLEIKGGLTADQQIAICPNCSSIFFIRDKAEEIKK